VLICELTKKEQNEKKIKIFNRLCNSIADIRHTHGDIRSGKVQQIRTQTLRWILLSSHATLRSIATADSAELIL